MSALVAISGHRHGRDDPLGTHRVDQRAARYLAQQRDQAGDRQHQADLDLRPFLRRQVDGDERTEAGLHVGDKEDEPVEPLQALPRGVRRGGGGSDTGVRYCRGSSLPDATRTRIGFPSLYSGAGFTWSRVSSRTMP